jgi:hypothetical protein
METLEKNPALQARLLKQKRLAVQVKVTGNATPASKKLTSDLSGVVIIAAEGQVASIPSGVTTVAPADATGKFSVIFDKAAIGELDKVLQVSVVNVTSTHAVASSISNGYLVVDVDSAADLSAADTEVRLIIDYLKK